MHENDETEQQGAGAKTHSAVKALRLVPFRIGQRLFRIPRRSAKVRVREYAAEIAIFPLRAPAVLTQQSQRLRNKIIPVSLKPYALLEGRGEIRYLFRHLKL